MSNLLLLLCLISADQQQPQRQWYSSPNNPGYLAYGWLNTNGWVIASKFRRLSDGAEFPPLLSEAAQIAQGNGAGPMPTEAAGNPPPPPGGPGEATRAVPVVPVAPVAATADPFGFVSWLNDLRVARGLPAVGYDPNLEVWGHRNNQSGIVHGVMGAARRQNQGWGDAAIVWAGWTRSPAHASALFDPTIRWVGIAYSFGSWTFSAY